MSKGQFAVSPASGPIVVTGASGYIGAWIVRDCVEKGYEVRACVRDTSNSSKTDHLLQLNGSRYAMQILNNLKSDNHLFFFRPKQEVSLKK